MKIITPRPELEDSREPALPPQSTAAKLIGGILAMCIIVGMVLVAVIIDTWLRGGGN
jgi:hypothetical protein